MKSLAYISFLLEHGKAPHAIGVASLSSGCAMAALSALFVSLQNGPFTDTPFVMAFCGMAVVVSCANRACFSHDHPENELDRLKSLGFSPADSVLLRAFCSLPSSLAFSALALFAPGAEGFSLEAGGTFALAAVGVVALSCFPAPKLRGFRKAFLQNRPAVGPIAKCPRSRTAALVFATVKESGKFAIAVVLAGALICAALAYLGVSLEAIEIATGVCYTAPLLSELARLEKSPYGQVLSAARRVTLAEWACARWAVASALLCALSSVAAVVVSIIGNPAGAHALVVLIYMVFVQLSLSLLISAMPSETARLPIAQLLSTVLSCIPIVALAGLTLLMSRKGRNDD